nr:zinc finger protein 1 homolog [Leptinotarsa decemlineata]
MILFCCSQFPQTSACTMEIKLLSCPVCSKPHFEGVDALRTTLVTVATSLVTCPVCCETLLGLDKLTIHLFSHISNATVTKSAVEDKVQYEIDQSIEDVSKSTGNEEQKVAPASEALTCDICNFSFTNRNLLEMHQKLLHKTSPDKKTGTYSYHCHLCSKKFRMRGSLMVHLRVAHYGFGRPDTTSNFNAISAELSTNREEEDKKEVDESKTLQKNVTVRPPDNKQWECDVCYKMFTTKYFPL